MAKQEEEELILPNTEISGPSDDWNKPPLNTHYPTTSNIIPRHEWETSTHDDRLRTNLSWHRIYIAMKKACNKKIKASQQRVTDSVAQHTVKELEKDVRKLGILIRKTTKLKEMVNDEMEEGWDEGKGLNEQWRLMEELWVVHKPFMKKPDYLGVDILLAALEIERKSRFVNNLLRQLKEDDDEE